MSTGSKFIDYRLPFLPSDDEAAWLIVCGDIPEATGPPSCIPAGNIHLENSYIGEQSSFAIKRLESLQAQGPPMAASAALLKVPWKKDRSL